MVNWILISVCAKSTACWAVQPPTPASIWLITWLLPCILQIWQVWDMASKKLAFIISTCLPLSRWICQLVLWGIWTWIFQHNQARSSSFTSCLVSLFKCNHSNLNPNSALYIINQGQQEVYDIEISMNTCHWSFCIRQQLRRWSRDIQAICQPLLSTTLPICKTFRISLSHMASESYDTKGMESYHKDWTIPYQGIRIIPYQGNGIIPYQGNKIIPWAWNYTIPRE